MKKLTLAALAGLCLGLRAASLAPATAAVLLPFGTNRGRVIELEMNYVPEKPQLVVAATLDNRFVKTAEYRNDAAIQNVLQFARFKDRGKLFVVYEENRIISFHVVE